MVTWLPPRVAFLPPSLFELVSTPCHHRPLTASPCQRPWTTWRALTLGRTAAAGLSPAVDDVGTTVCTTPPHAGDILGTAGAWFSQEPPGSCVATCRDRRPPSVDKRKSRRNL